MRLHLHQRSRVESIVCTLLQEMGLNSTLQCFCVLLILSCFIHQSETGPVMSKKVQQTCLFKGVEYEDRQFVPIPDTNCELCSCYKKQSVYCYGGSRCLET